MTKTTTFQDISLLLLRLILAAIFINAGIAKLYMWNIDPATMGMSEAMLNLTRFLGITETIGGIALIFGFLTFWAALGLAIIMAGANYFVYILMGSPLFTGMEGVGTDYTLTLFAACLILVAFGGGSWTIDRFIKKS